MDSGQVNDNHFPTLGKHDMRETDSAEDFQKFIYELFEKNGILNDLRAYLRGHIVNVLKSAQTGDPPACQKHFTQRLDLTFQALNILVAEYLMRMEFYYSLSVFISEIPLANMIFDFARSLLQCNTDISTRGLRIKDSDVWSILNYLGVKCDSDHASNIVETYKNNVNSPLLLCILQCMPMYRKQSVSMEQGNTSEDSLSSLKSSDTIEDRYTKNAGTTSYHDKCKHYSLCKTCQNRVSRLREKYRRKKKGLAKQNAKEPICNPIAMEKFMKNISVMEKSLIEEMFQQLKSVYESEVEMVKEEEERKMKRSLACHALQLQQKREEMEENFKAREAELERNIQQKKKFLWGLARALREQHTHMAQAMLAVRHETERLSAKEDSLKTQLAEAEQILKKRGEEMRTQISNELVILEGHLESMKKERDSINRERNQLEQMRESNSKVIKVHNLSDAHNESLHSHYDLLKNEFNILKKYLETTKLEPKCVIERGTMTELSETSKGVVLNNDVDKNCKSDNESGVRTPNQVVNDLKKHKNVNFSQSNLDEIYRERSRERSRSSASSEAGDAREGYSMKDYDLIQRLTDENERLKVFARQQREHIDELSSHQARLEAELSSTRAQILAQSTPQWRPRTAPAVMPQNYMQHVSHSASGNAFGWRKGAGEELSLFSNAQPRILVPGDTLPFIGVLRDRHADNKRHLINQWRSLRRRMSPLGGVAKLRASSPTTRDIHRDRPASAGPSISIPSPTRNESGPLQHNSENIAFTSHLRDENEQRPKTSVTIEQSKAREKSPKSVLREAKEKLRNKGNTKCYPPIHREKSPNSVLREAKLRLRKLEIEAEAVEKSYLNFRRRQTELRGDKNSRAGKENVVDKDAKDMDIKIHKPQTVNEYHNQNATYSQMEEAENSIKKDFDKYLKEYQTKFDITIGERFKNRNATNVKPIPEAYSKISDVQKEKSSNYLETPLTEFRKLYTLNQSPSSISEQTQRPKSPDMKKTESEGVSNKRRIKPKEKAEELEILKQNIDKIYNLPKENAQNDSAEESIAKHDSSKQMNSPNEVVENKNLLRIDVESVSESKNILPEKEQDEMLLIVESSIDSREIAVSESENETKILPQMTIIVSPKVKPISPKETSVKSNSKEESLKEKSRSLSPEQAANLTRNDVLDAIFHADKKDVSSDEMQLELSKEALEESDFEKAEEYIDDFSADVDNYNSRSDYENTPISLPKTSEDENFWDS